MMIMMRSYSAWASVCSILAASIDLSTASYAGLQTRKARNVVLKALQHEESHACTLQGALGPLGRTSCAMKPR